MISNRLKYLVIAIFILFLICGLVFTVLNFGDTSSWYENRMLNPMPELTLQGVMDGSYFTELEKFLVDRSAGRNQLLEIKTLSDSILFSRPQVNGTVITDDTLLMYRDYAYSDSTQYSAEWYAGEMAELNALVKSYGGYFCYVGVPNQYNFYDGLYPTYLESMAEETDLVNAEFTAFAAEYGIPYIDMGPILEDGNNSDDLYFKTDHHYTLRGAYLTYTAVIDRINADCNSSLFYPREDEGEIHFTELDNPYIGSHARKIFGLCNISEHLLHASFSNVIPFKRYDNGAESYPYVYAAPGNSTVDMLYTYYMGGDIANTVIDTEREYLPTVLIYGDSFTNALECLAYYSFDEMHSIDLRHYNKTTLADYIEQLQPDYVICIRDYDNLVMPYGNGDVFGKSKN